MAAGCSFESGLEGSSCSDAGAERGEAVCRDGYWVNKDAVVDDADGTERDACEESEICGNDRDDDCDGTVDEGCPCIFDGDDDGETDDERGICTDQEVGEDGECQMPDDFLSQGESENEVSAGSNYCDGKDNDCDGAADEGCSCTYDGDGDGETDDEQGVCVDRTVGDDGECSRPADYVSPDEVGDDESSVGSGNEFCDGKDNDCDGETDEGCPCDNPGQTRDCGTDEGICETGTQRCTNNGWGACQNQVEPTDETCDGDDNDCDGQVDENLRQRCSDQKGVCAGATVACQGGKFPDCGSSEYGSAYESDEANCDGLDNDCDGQVDESLTRNCSKQKGVCSGATVSCQGGSYPNCDASQYGGNYESGGEKTCDGRDNDCDGDVDEGLTQKCTNQTGVCGGATVSCQGGKFPTCGSSEFGTAYESDESSCDGLDNDCDGNVDENLTKQCSEQKGVCSGSNVSCSGGSYPACTDSGVGYPSSYQNPESNCEDSKDNDCDADTDCADGDCNGLPCNGSGTACSSSGTTCLETNCTNGMSDDSDNLVDCGDEWCRNNSSVCNQRIFVTSAEFQPGASYDTSCNSPPCGTGPYRFESVSEADTICQDLASNAGLSGTWRAILSDNNNDAKSHISLNGILHNLAGEEISASNSDLWDGTITNEIEYDETVSSVTSQSTDVWTGTRENGRADSELCEDSGLAWSADGTGGEPAEGEYGDASRSDGEWVYRDDSQPFNLQCNQTARIYCVDGQ